MGSVRGKPVYFKLNNGLPLALQEKTSSEIPNQEIFRMPCHQGIPGNDTDGRGTENQGYFRKTIFSRPRFLFENVPGKEIRRRLAANFQPQGSKYVCSNQTFSVNITDGCGRLPAGERLVSEGRSSPGLFPSECRGDSQKVFTGCLRWRDPAVNSTSVRPIIGTSFVCSSFQLGGRGPPGSGYTPLGIPRRLYPSLSGQIQTYGTGCGNAGHFGIFGLACKLPEVCYRANTQVGILRAGLGHSERDSSLAHPQSSGYKKLSDKYAEPRQLLTKGASKFVRQAEFRQPGRPSRPASLSQGTALSEKIFPERPEENTLPQSARGLAVVVGCSRGQSSPTTQERNYSFLNNRRSGCGLGSELKQPIPLGQVGNKPKSLALQSEGDVCRFRRHQVPGRTVTKCPHSNTVRQQDAGSIHPESRWNSFAQPTGTNNQVIGIDLSIQHNDDSIPLTREPERHRRLPIKGKVSTRVASATTSHGGIIQTVGRSRSRSVRYKANRCCSKVCDFRLKRWLGAFLRRFQSKVGSSDSMGIPTSEHDSQGLGASKQCSRDILCNSATMDPVLLVPRSPGTCASPPAADRELEGGSVRLDDEVEPSSSRQAKASSLESWGWEDKVTDWSREEQQLLKKSWRPSTLSTYNAPIKRWLHWSKSHGINSKCPEGKDVARFLANLYLQNKFAYSTIMLHKSAISTYCAATVENLSKNFFIQQVLKAISLTKPHPAKLPIWDVNILFDWLKSSTRSHSLFDQSRRTALILLLASGRRLHDLTLLELSEQGFTESDDTVTFWPRFGSKTDTGSHRQSGWLLIRHQESKICPVTHVKELIKSLEARRSQDSQIKSLFISITGVVKPASKTMIAGWVRSAFKLAKIDASPGSIRSAVASRGWLDNRPIQEILERGNWKCVETFSKYYCKEVNRSIDDNTAVGLLYNNFKTV